VLLVCYKPGSPNRSAAVRWVPLCSRFFFSEGSSNSSALRLNLKDLLAGNIIYNSLFNASKALASNWVKKLL
jgi:hypothetical protein